MWTILHLIPESFYKPCAQLMAPNILWDGISLLLAFFEGMLSEFLMIVVMPTDASTVPGVLYQFSAVELQAVLDYILQIKDFRVIFLPSLNMGEVKLFTWVDVLGIETFHLTECLGMYINTGFCYLLAKN